MIETCYEEVQRKPRLVLQVCASLPWSLLLYLTAAVLFSSFIHLYLIYPSVFISLTLYPSHINCLFPSRS